MTDADLVRQAKAGRTDAFAELTQRWTGRVTALCHARTRNAHLADDLTQEALLRAFRALGSLSDPERFGAWLCGIALRIWIDWSRARKNKQILFSTLSPEQNPDTWLGRADPNLAERADDCRQLMTEVEALPEECRQVIMLYYYQDITYRQIANLLGVSPATVNARLTRARTLLRARLTDSMR